MSDIDTNADDNDDDNVEPVMDPKEQAAIGQDLALTFFREVRAGEKNGVKFADSVKYHKHLWSEFISAVFDLPDSAIVVLTEEVNTLLLLQDFKIKIEELLEEIEAMRHWMPKGKAEVLRDIPTDEYPTRKLLIQRQKKEEADDDSDDA